MLSGVCTVMVPSYCERPGGSPLGRAMLKGKPNGSRADRAAVRPKLSVVQSCMQLAKKKTGIVIQPGRPTLDDELKIISG